MLAEVFIFVASAMFLASQVSSMFTTGRYWIRLSLYFALLAILSLAAFPICLVLTILGKRYNTNYWQSKIFYFGMTWLLGVEIEVEGVEHLKANPAIYIGNHQSSLDVFYISRIFPERCTIMAKKELQWVPVLGWWMTLSGTIWIDRKNSKNAMKSAEKVGSDITNRSLSIYIFPEGTRTSFETPNLLPFKKGAFHIAVKAGVPVVPVVCENYWRLFRPGVFESGKIKIKVLPAIPTKGLTANDVTDLAIRTRELMLATLKEISVDVSEEVAAVDNAKLDKISRRGPPTSATEAPAASPPTSEGAGPGSVPRESITPRLQSQELPPTPAPKKPGPGGSTQQGQGHKDSPGGSNGGTDDEMVIVDRPN